MFPSLARDLPFLVRINHNITAPITSNAIPTLTPIMVGIFDEVDEDDRSEAGREVTGREELEDRDNDVDGVIVGV